MTVHRDDMGTFNTSKDRLIEHTRDILNRNPVYRNTTEEQSGAVFITTVKPVVKPDWLLLGTKMIVQLDGTETTSTAKVSTVSQWFIMGDVLNYYNRYMSEFLAALREAVNK